MNGVVAALLRQVDALAYNRMNVLHWHAVDAAAFPLQSARFPDLSRLGAYAYADPRATYSPADVSRVLEHARAAALIEAHGEISPRRFSQHTMHTTS